METGTEAAATAGLNVLCSAIEALASDVKVKSMSSIMDSQQPPQTVSRRPEELNLEKSIEREEESPPGHVSHSSLPLSRLVPELGRQRLMTAMQSGFEPDWQTGEYLPSSTQLPTQWLTTAPDSQPSGGLGASSVTTGTHQRGFSGSVRTSSRG